MGGPRFWIAAGEASGDRLAAGLIETLGRDSPDLVARGLAGPAMRAAGVEVAARSEDATAMGVVEVVSALPRLARLLRRLVDDATAFRPDVVVTVDSPDLLLRLGRRLRRRGLRVVHWVAPQFWAWRPGRIASLARSVDSVMCLLPFEAPRLAGHVRAVFTGHPAVAGLGPGPPAVPITVALLPGSRPGEIARHWPVMRAVARRLRRRWPDCRFRVARAPTVAAGRFTGLEVAEVDGVAACAGAAVAICASGTATLELAAMGVPMVVIYQVHPATWALARRLVRGVDHVALPNILAGKSLVPEILQHLDPDRIASEAVRVAQEPGSQVPAALIASLRGDAAFRRAAEEVRHGWRLSGSEGPPAGATGS